MVKSHMTVIQPDGALLKGFFGMSYAAIEFKELTSGRLCFFASQMIL